MNFFQHQDAARKQTGRLVLLFGLAVVGVFAAVYLIVSAVFWVNDKNYPFFSVHTLWNPPLLFFTALGVASVICAGSMYKIAVLGGGGKAVAEMLGGRLLTATTTDWRERRLLNVVEEMALASGMPVPAVYLLDHETQVNAFAAGFTPADAVLGITRGTMETLTRDELQGVVAHEFSHIFNGDMRLNLRLMGLLHGILLLSLIGYFLLRVVLSGSNTRRSSSNKKDGGGGILLAVIGIGAGLYIIGYIGVFFGKLIKSAVSRQREFLADASAVQFTRNPAGIAGALKKIGALGSRLESARAEEASHLYFGNGVGKSFLSLMATHPPLADRVRRLEPTFDGDFSKDKLPWPDEAREKAALAAPRRPARPLPAKSVAAAGAAVLGFTPERAVASVGTPQPQHLDYAENLLANLPAEVDAELHEPLGAAAVVYALLLHADPGDDEPGLKYLAEQIDGEIADRARRMLGLLAPLNVGIRLPLAQLSMTALRQLTPPQFEQFRRAVVALIRADRKVSLFEFGLHRMILKHLADHFEPTRPRLVVYHSVSEVAGPVAIVLSAASRAGAEDDDRATGAAYEAGRKSLNAQMPPQPLGQDACDFARLDEALHELAAASGEVKQAVLGACAASIGRDGTVTLDEGELLRTIADALDAPMPPLAAAVTT